MPNWQRIGHFVQNPYLCTPMEESKLNWYALKVFYGKVFEIEARLGDMDL